MSISRERFTELMHNALRKRKISKTDRDAMINRDWFLVESDNAEPDSIIEYEESLTRDYLANQKKAKAVPLESAEQAQVVKWFRNQYKGVMIFSSLNGEALAGSHAAWQKALATGALPGVADLQVPQYNLWIEMKRQKGSKWLDSQIQFKHDIESIGHTYLLCYGFEDAKKQILEILK